MKSSTLAQNPWTSKLDVKKLPKRVRLDKDFAGIKAGLMLFVGTPQIINSYGLKTPPGETRTIERMRRELARSNQCDATCPVSTAIFLRISAQAAIEQMNNGQAIATVAPFWRIVEPQSTIAGKLSIDPQWIAHQRAQESTAAPLNRAAPVTRPTLNPKEHSHD